MKAVKIYGVEKEVLSVGLNDLLTLFNKKDQLYWCMLFVEAVGKFREIDILEFEKMVYEAKDGLQMSFYDLKMFASEAEQLLNVVLIGNEETKRNKRYKNDDDMYGACDFTIELVDSSYWLIHARDYRDLTLFLGIDGAVYTEE